MRGERVNFHNTLKIYFLSKNRAFNFVQKYNKNKVNGNAGEFALGYNSLYIIVYVVV